MFCQEKPPHSGQIVPTIVSYDMGWSKRGAGNQYESLNGYGALIGYFGGKVLDFGTRNRKCKACSMGSPKDAHDCRLNFQGTAKAMEADLGAELITNSSILKDCNLSVEVVIGDEDAATMATVRRYAQNRIFKIADRNHLNKNFGADIYGLKHLKINELSSDVIAHIRKCFLYAIVQHRGQSEKLRETLYAIPEHLFGRHQHCQEWCKAVEKGSQTVLLKNETLYESLKTIFAPYAENAEKFSIAGSSQPNESLNSIMWRKCPKQHCYSLSESADNRYASSVLVKSEGNVYLLDVLKRRGLPISNSLENYLNETDNKRKKRSMESRTCEKKKQRKRLAKEREALRKKKGTQRASNTKRSLVFNWTCHCHKIKSKFRGMKVLP